jgi:prolyl-tRNA synthetase
VLSEEWLALPVLTGRKTENERFRGAVHTYCIEAMMRDGKALQAGTSHNLGQNFAKAFGIQFQSQAGPLEFAYQTSWGVSTRLVGALVLGHGDEKGLVLPPRLAPYQVVIVPIYKTDEEKTSVLARCREIEAQLKERIRVHIDARDQHTPGFKFNHWEVRGVPVRLNIGPKDVANNVVELARRDTGEKIRGISQDGLCDYLVKFLDDFQKGMFDRALKFREERTKEVATYDEFKKLIENNGFLIAHWCKDGECEVAIKNDTKATIRCLPFNFEPSQGKCIRCERPTDQKVVFARSY